MKTLGALCVCLIACVLAQAPTERPKTFTRDLPADTLRDFPGFCFASTNCKIFNVTDSWPLFPFCGVATCVKAPDGSLIERVQDCGPLPEENVDCKITNIDAVNSTFPDCCPIFECKPGVVLKYPDPPQPAPSQ